MLDVGDALQLKVYVARASDERRKKDAPDFTDLSVLSPASGDEAPPASQAYGSPGPNKLEPLDKPPSMPALAPDADA